jgi:hypothetical protein
MRPRVSFLKIYLNESINTELKLDKRKLKEKNQKRNSITAVTKQK